MCFHLPHKFSYYSNDLNERVPTMRFASLLTVDRHGLRPRDDKMCHGALCLSLRGGQNGRRGNPSCLEGRDRVCLFASLLTVDRHRLSALAMTRCGSDGVYQSRTTNCVIARKERSEGRGNPLYAMNTFRQCVSLPSSQWIATGFQPSR
jgi:hypothetical protein